MKTVEAKEKSKSESTASTSSGQAPSGQAALGELRTVKRAELLGSPTNPRKSFPEATLKELAESIKGQGVQHPLLVRPWPKFAPMKNAAWTAQKHKAGAGRLEIVDGERRYRASELAGVKELPVIVKELTDEQVVEIQLISFLQREDVSALEEGESYRQLIDAKIHTVESLMAKLGKSRAHVYGRLALCKASDAVKAAMAKGEVDATVAQLIASLPTAELQAELLEYATDEWDKPSFRDIKQTIEDDYLQNLKKAVFKLDELVTVPKLKPQPTTCAECPKRTGNIPGAEGSPNVCTDVACFKAKQAASVQQKLDAAKAQGKGVVGVEEYKKARHGTFREANETCYEDDKRRTYGELAKKAGVETLLTASEEKGLIGVYSSGEVATMFEKAGIKKERSSSGYNSAAERKKQEKMKAAQAKLKASVDGVLETLRGKIKKDGINPVALRLLADEAAWDHNYMERHKLKTNRDVISAWAKKLSEADANVVLLEASFCGTPVEYYADKFCDRFTNICAAYGIDLKKVAEKAKSTELPGAKFEKAATKQAKPASKVKKGKKKK